MNPEVVAKSLPILGAIAALSLFLPGVERAWDAESADPEMRMRIRTGEVAYFTAGLALGGLFSYSTGSALPLFLALGWVGMVIGMHEIALAHNGSANVALR